MPMPVLRLCSGDITLVFRPVPLTGVYTPQNTRDRSLTQLAELSADLDPFWSTSRLKCIDYIYICFYTSFYPERLATCAKDTVHTYDPCFSTGGNDIHNLI